MAEIYTLTEFQSVITGKTAEGYITVPEHTFQSLQNFLLENKGRKNALEFMSITARKGLGTVITAQNYVGMIAMNNGTVFEILPKIYHTDTGAEGIRQTKKILLDMLRTLPNAPFKSIQTSNMNTEKMPLLELFIRKFLDEVLSIVKHGLKHSYNPMESNELFLKGQLIFPEQIRKNFAHRERNYIRYDVFNDDCPENRLLKATLLFASRRSVSAKNRRDIRNLLDAFDLVPASTNYEVDFENCSSGRDVKEYRLALIWAKVFLQSKSFTAYSGSEVSFALLYPMETIFESYIAHKMRQHIDRTAFTVTAQEKKKYLFQKPEKHFLLKPDIVVRHHTEDRTFIMDTKWKILDEGKGNYGISQGDMYQMYAYQKRYAAQSVTLIYPLAAETPQNQKIWYQSEDNAFVYVRFVDLLHIDSSIDSLITETINQSNIMYRICDTIHI